MLLYYTSVSSEIKSKSALGNTVLQL